MTEIAKLFKQKGFATVQKMVCEPQLTEYYQYALDNTASGDLQDRQAPGSPSFYHDQKFAILHNTLLINLEQLTALKLLPTYCYYRTYRKGARLSQHTDRPACEISMTINIGRQGEPWGFHLIDYDKEVHHILLEPGDAVIYRGCDLIHWREELVHADFVTQVFMHYVIKEGVNAFAYQEEKQRRLQHYIQSLEWQKSFEKLKRSKTD